MAGKSYQERLEAYEKRIGQLQARKEQLQTQLKNQERRQRTRRLIQVGAIMAHLGIETPEQADALRRIVEANSRLGQALRSAISVATGQGSQ